MAEKLPAYQDPSVQLLTFLTGLGGTKQSATQTSTSAGDPRGVAALQQLLETQLGQTTPEGIQGILQALFQKGAEQVPVLGMQFAQSAGARGSNNSSLNIANQQLQARLAAEAMAQLLAAQKAAGETAGRLTEANKTTTTSTSQNSKSAKPGLAALPFILGQVGNIKKGLNGISDLFSSDVDTGFGSVTGGSGGFGQVVNNPSMFMGGVGDTVDVTALTDNAFNSFDLGNFADLAMADMWGSYSDLPSMGLEGLDSILNTAGDAGLSAFDFLGFADGGQVKLGGMNLNAIRRREEEAEGKRPVSKPKAPASAPAQEERPRSGNLGARFLNYLKGYADGGVVRAGSKKKFADGGQVRGISAVDAVEPDLTYYETADTPSAGISLGTTAGVSTPTGSTRQQGGATVNPATGLPDYSNEMLPEDVLTYFSSTLGEDRQYNPLAKNYYEGQDGKMYQLQYEDFSTGTGEDYMPSFGKVTGVRQSGADYLSKDYHEKNPFDKVFNISDGSFQDIQINTPNESGLGSFLSFLTAAVAMATGNPALAFARGVGTRATADFARSVLNDGNKGKITPNMFGGTYKDKARPTWDQPQSIEFNPVNGYKNGGEVDGPGTSISDSIPILVSDGEYIVPADTVEAFGVEFFDALRDATHVPASLQRFHAAGVK